ncbi:pilus assembly protein [Dyella sp. A6]|uniref:pilus assembly protein n=1 Tax=Dyella aluminiiresistens TaxID=3069105 RepID=UPI002E77FC03|nr:pilus assembly protein [Dyella sp. A6]
MAIEFALVFLLGLLPLLLLTFTAVLIFTARESLTLAASNGARAALHYGTDAERGMYACQAAENSMQWLMAFSTPSGNTAPSCSSSGISNNVASVVVSAPGACSGTVPANVECMTVTASYNYDSDPFLPGTKTLYGWVIGQPISSTAIIQIDTDGG